MTESMVYDAGLSLICHCMQHPLIAVPPPPHALHSSAAPYQPLGSAWLLARQSSAPPTAEHRCGGRLRQNGQAAPCLLPAVAGPSLSMDSAHLQGAPGEDKL